MVATLAHSQSSDSQPVPLAAPESLNAKEKMDADRIREVLLMNATRTLSLLRDSVRSSTLAFSRRHLVSGLGLLALRA